MQDVGKIHLLSHHHNLWTNATHAKVETPIAFDKSDWIRLLRPFMSVEPEQPHSCAICGKVYRRKAHLSRHETTHSEIRRYECNFCEKTFSRSDICRKHCTKCPQRGSGEYLPTLSRGRKPGACQSCSRSKVSCDKGEPCGRCRYRHLTCSYRRLQNRPPVEDTPVIPLASSTRLAEIRISKPSVPFFLKLTNSAAATMLESFTDDDEVSDFGDITPVGAAQNTIQEDDPYFWELASIFGLERLQSDSVGGTTVPANILSTAPIFEARAMKTLEAKSNIIIKELHALHLSLTAFDAMYEESFDIGTASLCFSPQNMIRFAAAYFQLSHNYVSIVHRASFGSESTALSLLLAVTLAGSMRSPPRDDALGVRSFVRLLEEYIFRRLGLIVSTHVEASGELLETFQAAILVTNVQFMANVVPTRRRIRTHRLPVLVSIIRQLSFAEIKHSPEVDWHQFVQKESCIRIAHWTAMADWHLSGMFHMPPLLSVFEMTGDMPCSLDLWDASNTSEFEARVQWPLRPDFAHSVRDCTRILLEDQASDTKVARLVCLSMSDMQLVIMGLICCIISANLMSTISTSAQALLRALSIWQSLWTHITSTTDKEKIKMSGIERYSDEQCFLARKMIEALLSGDRLPPYLEKVGHDTLAELHDFLLQSYNA